MLINCTLVSVTTQTDSKGTGGPAKAAIPRLYLKYPVDVQRKMAAITMYIYLPNPTAEVSCADLAKL